jgi:hypothetical protein
MTQTQHIIDRFSDSFVAAMLEGTDTAEVLASYERTYPELGAQLREYSRSLSLLYGYFETTEHPNDAAIASAYKHFKLPNPVAQTVTRSQPGLFSRLGLLFASQTGYRLAASMAVVVLALFLWRPWSADPTLGPPIVPSVSDHDNTAPNATAPSTEGRQNQTSSTPEQNASQFRGADDHSSVSPAPTAEEIARLKHLSLTGQIAQPKDLTLEPGTAHSIKLQWQPVEGAQGYIVEVKAENDEKFHAVAQVAHANARIGALVSGQTISVRVTAIKRQAKGPASGAQSIVVP